MVTCEDVLNGLLLDFLVDLLFDFMVDFLTRTAVTTV